MFNYSDKVKKYFLTGMMFAIICSGCTPAAKTEKPAEGPTNTSTPAVTTTPVETTTPPSIGFVPDKAYNEVGNKTIYLKQNDSLSNADNLVVEIRAKEVADLFGLAFQINFDSSLLTYMETTSGELLGNDLLFQSQLEEGSSNKLLVGLSRKRGAGEISGSGTVAAIKFSRKSNGNGAINFTNNQARRSGNVTLSDVVWNGGTVKITG